MSIQDKTVLMHKIDETLKPRMFANLLEEAQEQITTTLDDFDVTYTGSEQNESCDLLDAFINAKKAAGLTDKTLFKYRYQVGRFLRYAEVHTRNVTSDHVRNYFAAELARGISDTTVRGYRDDLNSYFGWLFNNRLISINPMASVEPVKCEIKEKTAFSSYELDRLKRNCENKRDLALLYFLFATGCRIGEVVSLNRSDINIGESECIVYGKGKKERTVFMTDDALVVLREYLASRTDNYEPLFLNRLNRRLQAGGIRFRLHQLADKAGVENVHPHRFRRTLITFLLNRGMPIQEVMIIAGHSKADTTMRYYSCNKSRIKNSYMVHTT